MTTKPQTPSDKPHKKTQEKDPSRGRLLRSPSERMVAGVAGGTGQYLGVDPTLVRLGFVAATFIGGAGILAYLVMAVIVPRDDGTGNPVDGEGTGARAVKLLAYGLIAVVAIGAAVSAAALGAFATATGNGVIVAGAVIALGVAVAATAFIGDGSGAKRSAPWLLAVALILAIPSGAVAAADVRFDGGIGERTYSPATAAEIPADGYELGIGQMKVDLREVDLAPGESVRLPAELGIGQLILAVPSGVCVTGHAEAKGGDLLVRGVSNSGANPEFDRGGPAPGSKLPVVEIDAELQFGQLVVTDRDPDEFGGDDRGPGPGPDGEQPDEITDEPVACAG